MVFLLPCYLASGLCDGLVAIGVVTICDIVTVYKGSSQINGPFNLGWPLCLCLQPLSSLSSHFHLHRKRIGHKTMIITPILLALWLDGGFASIYNSVTSSIGLVQFYGPLVLEVLSTVISSFTPVLVFILWIIASIAAKVLAVLKFTLDLSIGLWILRLWNGSYKNSETAYYWRSYKEDKNPYIWSPYYGEMVSRNTYFASTRLFAVLVELVIVYNYYQLLRPYRPKVRKAAIEIGVAVCIAVHRLRKIYSTVTAALQAIFEFLTVDDEEDKPISSTLAPKDSDKENDDEPVGIAGSPIPYPRYSMLDTNLGSYRYKGSMDPIYRHRRDIIVRGLPEFRPTVARREPIQLLPPRRFETYDDPPTVQPKRIDPMIAAFKHEMLHWPPPEPKSAPTTTGTLDDSHKANSPSAKPQAALPETTTPERPRVIIVKEKDMESSTAKPEVSKNTSSSVTGDYVLYARKSSSATPQVPPPDTMTPPSRTVHIVKEDAESTTVSTRPSTSMTTGDYVLYARTSSSVTPQIPPPLDTTTPQPPRIPMVKEEDAESTTVSKRSSSMTTGDYIIYARTPSSVTPQVPPPDATAPRRNITIVRELEENTRPTPVPSEVQERTSTGSLVKSPQASESTLSVNFAPKLDPTTTPRRNVTSTRQEDVSSTLVATEVQNKSFAVTGNITESLQASESNGVQTAKPSPPATEIETEAPAQVEPSEQPPATVTQSVGLEQTDRSHSMAVEKQQDGNSGTTTATDEQAPVSNATSSPPAHSQASDIATSTVTASTPIRSSEQVETDSAPSSPVAASIPDSPSSPEPLSPEQYAKLLDTVDSDSVDSEGTITRSATPVPRTPADKPAHLPDSLFAGTLTEASQVRMPDITRGTLNSKLASKHADHLPIAQLPFSFSSFLAPKQDSIESKEPKESIGPIESSENQHGKNATDVSKPSPPGSPAEGTTSTVAPPNSSTPILLSTGTPSTSAATPQSTTPAVPLSFGIPFTFALSTKEAYASVSASSSKPANKKSGFAVSNPWNLPKTNPTSGTGSTPVPATSSARPSSNASAKTPGAKSTLTPGSPALASNNDLTATQASPANPGNTQPRTPAPSNTPSEAVPPARVDKGKGRANPDDQTEPETANPVNQTEPENKAEPEPQAADEPNSEPPTRPVFDFDPALYDLSENADNALDNALIRKLAPKPPGSDEPLPPSGSGLSREEKDSLPTAGVGSLVFYVHIRCWF